MTAISSRAVRRQLLLRGLIGDKRSVEDEPGELPGVAALRDNVGFPSTLPFGIPPLREDRLWTPPSKIETWVDDRRSSDDGVSTYVYMWRSGASALWPAKRGLLGFYVDDEKFECFWRKPEAFTSKLLNRKVAGVMSPNFSLWSDQPQAVHIYNTYRSRWIGRFFQEAGLCVLPDVNWSREDSWSFCLLGLPRQAWLSVQVQTVSGDERDVAVAGLRRVEQELEPAGLVVYGSEKSEVVARAKLSCQVVRITSRGDLMARSIRRVSSWK